MQDLLDAHRNEIADAMETHNADMAFGDVRPALVAAFDAEAYFADATAVECLNALDEMSFTLGLPKSGTELAKLCAQLAREEQWLPPELRIGGRK